MSNKDKFGICKLTREEGKFVKSHIIPQAFIKLENKKETRVEFEATKPTVKRHTSWYDQNLCTRKGEDILSGLDDWAYKTFTKEKLVWGSWKEDPKSFSYFNKETDRIVEFDSWTNLRKFGLSLLWRACASERPQMRDIWVSPENLERLRKAILDEGAPSSDLYPFILLQITSLGPEHNMTPINVRRPLPNPFKKKTEEVEEDFIRFYFDGLTILFLNSEKSFHYALCNKKVFNCTDGKVPIICHRFENSFQDRNMKLAIRQHMERFPKTVAWLNRK